MPLQADPPVLRAGDTVCRRSTGPAVHALLVHLGRVGLPYSLRFVGFDDRGRAILTSLSSYGPMRGTAFATAT